MSKHNDRKHSGRKGVMGTFLALLLIGALAIAVPVIMQDGKDYDKWLGNRKKPTHRDLLRMAIDEALAQNPKDMDAVISLLCDAGYEVKRGKVPAFRREGQKKFLRMDTLGDGYRMEELAAVLEGRRKHVPRRARGADSAEKVSLLIDIQRKLSEGKGAGYQRWATVFNLKQMAQSLNYLREHLRALFPWHEQERDRKG